MTLGKARRRAALVALLAAAGMAATLLASPADAKPPKHKPTKTPPTATATTPPAPTPTIPSLPSSAPEPPAKTYCGSYDPTAPSQCILKAKTYTETITYQDATGATVTAKVPAIRPLTLIDVLTGPNGKTEKRISVPSVCAYYQIYTGQRLATYPAPDIFIGKRPASYWITNADNPDFKTHRFFQMQLPNGIGRVEAPYNNFYTKKSHMGLTETYDDWIHLDFYNPGAYDDAYNHRFDNVGYWWDYQCSFARYRNITNTHAPEWLKTTLRNLHRDNPYWWEFWLPGQENPPTVPTPTIPLPDILKMVVPNLDLGAKPPYDNGLVKLPQFMWVRDEIGRYPITIRVGGQEATATPGPITAANLPNGATSKLKCTDGGNPDALHERDSDCWVKFTQTTPKDQPLSLTFHQTWTVRQNGRPVAGPEGTITTTTTHNFTIKQTEAAGGN